MYIRYVRAFSCDGADPAIEFVMSPECVYAREWIIKNKEAERIGCRGGTDCFTPAVAILIDRRCASLSPATRNHLREKKPRVNGPMMTQPILTRI